MKKYRHGVMLITAFIVGCGGDSGEGVAQPNSTIRMVPASVGHSYRGDQITVSGGVVTSFVEDFVTVTVLNENGNPIRNAQTRFYHMGPGTMANINRVLQAEPYITSTDDFGNVYLYIYTPTFNNVGATPTDFEAFSGSAFQKMTVTMTCTDVNTATSTICD